MDDDDLLNSDLFGRAEASSKSKAKGRGGSAASSVSGGNNDNDNDDSGGAVFNPAAIFAPTVKAPQKAGGGAKSSRDMGLDSLDALLKTAQRREREVAAVSRNAYKGLGGGEGEGEMEEVDEAELEALQALVKGARDGDGDGGQSEDGSASTKKPKKSRQIFDDDDDDEHEGGEREELGDWMGLASVFRMADPAAFPSLALPASLPEAASWGTEGRRLKQALVGAEAKGLLPDLLSLMGPARWLQATDAAAPAGLIDWLWKCVAWHTDPAVSHGAFRTLKMLLRGEDGLGPYPKALQGWTLPFPFLQSLLAPYGVQLRPSDSCYATFRGRRNAPNDTPQPSTLDTYNLPALGAADLTATAAGRRAALKLEREGIPPTVNLRGLFSLLAWCLRDGRVGFGRQDEATALLYALLVLSVDRYIQADCPDALRGAVAALLHVTPEGGWPTPTLAAVLDALIPPGSDANPPPLAPVRLGAASLLHIARSALPALAPGRAGDRARALVAAILRRVIEGRVLLAYASKQEGPSPGLVALQALPHQTLADRQRYLLTLLDALLGLNETPNSPHGPCPEAAAALAPAANGYTPPEGEGDGSEDGTGLDRVLFLAYALAMWTQLSLAAQGGGGGNGGGAGRAFAAEVGGKLARLERGKLRNQSEEAVQGAKDVLTQAVASAQAMAPKGPTQMKLTAFACKSSGGDIDDD